MSTMVFYRQSAKQRRLAKRTIRAIGGLRRQLVRIAGEADRHCGECVLLIESYELFRDTQTDAARAAGRARPRTERVGVPRSLRRFVQGRREIEVLR